MVLVKRHNYLDHTWTGDQVEELCARAFAVAHRAAFHATTFFREYIDPRL